MTCISTTVLAYTFSQASPPQYLEAARYATAATALRPKSTFFLLNLGNYLSGAGKHQEAEAYLREGLKLNPKSAKLHECLARNFASQDKYTEALAEYQISIQLDPEFPGTYSNLGNLFRKMQRVDEAIAAHEKAIRLKPDSGHYRSNLGVALRSKGKLDEAIAAFREAIRIHPGLARTHVNLGLALASQGKLDEAISAFQDAIHADPGFGGGHIELAKALAIKQLDAEFALIVQGDAGTMISTKRVQLAEFAAVHKHRPEIAVKWYAQAFAEDPRLATDVQTPHRYNAACSALLTAAGKGKDADKLEDAERARLIHQALVWLRDDLAGWKTLAESVNPEQLPQVVQSLVHWQEDPDLASLRDDKQVQQLPAEDQDICRKLWADHAELVKSLQARLPADKK